MIIGFGNNVSSTIASDITATQTTFSVIPGDGDKFANLLTVDISNPDTPHEIYAKITLTNNQQTVFEICHLTAVTQDSLTVIRGQEGTAAKGWSLNDIVSNFATRGSENTFVQVEQLQGGDYTSAIAGGTPDSLTVSLPSTFLNNNTNAWSIKVPLLITPIAANTGAVTLQLTLAGRVIGTFPMYKGNQSPLNAGDLIAGVPFCCLLDQSKTFFNVINPVAAYTGGVKTVNGHAPDGSGAVSVNTIDIYRDQAIRIGDAVDLNTLVEPGLYYQDSIALAQTGANYPEVTAGSLEIFKHAGITQVYRVYAGSRSYSRSMNEGVWSTWSMSYNGENRPSAIDIGAVPLYPQGEVRDVITMLGLRQIYTQHAGSALELGHQSGAPGEFLIDIHTGGVIEAEDFTTRFTFRTNGGTYLTHDFSADLVGSVGELQCGSGAVRILIDGNILAPVFNGGNLMIHLNGLVNDVQYGAMRWQDYAGGGQVIAGSGEVMCGLQEQQDDNEIHGYWFKPQQKFMSGAWVNVIG